MRRNPLVLAALLVGAAGVSLAGKKCFFGKGEGAGLFSDNTFF